MSKVSNGNELADRVRDSSVQSVDRAISVLQVIARMGSAGVTEISNSLTVHKSTVSRLLNTLEARGMVEQDSIRGRYRLGYGVVQLAEGANKRSNYPVISRAICSDLAQSVGETVHVVVHSGHSIVTIDQVLGASSISTVNTLGQHDPIYPTSAGKVFLASLPQDELRSALDAQPLTRFTNRTIVDRHEYEAELKRVRERGYAVSLEEHQIGMVGVSAPIRGVAGEVIAALVVSGPAFRIAEARIPEIADQLMNAADQVSEKNGYPKAG